MPGNLWEVANAHLHPISNQQPRHFLPERAVVEPELGVVVLPEELGVDLGDAVDGLGPLDADVGRGVARGLGPEGADGRRHEDLQVVLLRKLHHVVQP